MADDKKNEDFQDNVQKDDIGEQILADISNIDQNKKSNDIVVGEIKYRKDYYVVAFLAMFIILFGGLTFLGIQYTQKVQDNKPEHNVKVLMKKAGASYSDEKNQKMINEKGKVSKDLSDNNKQLLKKSQDNIDKAANQTGYNSNGFKIDVKDLATSIQNQTNTINDTVYKNNMYTTQQNLEYYKSVLANLKDGSAIKGKSPFKSDDNVGNYLKWALYNHQSFDSVTSFSKDNQYSSIYNNYAKSGFEKIGTIDSIYVEKASKKMDDNVSILKATIVSGSNTYVVDLGYYEQTNSDGKTTKGYNILDITTN